MDKHRPIKIAISGTHGTGKTTTVNALARTFNAQNVIVVPEFARTYAINANDPGILMAGKDRPISQLLSLVHYPVMEAQAYRENPDLIICDRGVLDSLSYVLEVGVKMSAPELAYVKSLLQSHAKTYDRVFYHPIEFALKKDGIRNLDYDFQYHMDEVIKSAWKNAGVSLIEVRGGIQDRVRTIARNLPQKLTV